MSDLPPDVYREIFLLLPAKYLIRFRAVCKLWRAVIDDPCFVTAHTNKQLSPNTILIRNSTGHPFFPLYSFDVGNINFTNGFQSIAATPLNFSRSGLLRLSDLPVADCNGLLLVATSSTDGDYKENWEIWNPLTHERLELPRLDIGWNAFGLGYDCDADDYKAVVIVRLRNNGGRYDDTYQTHIYSLKSDSWKRIRDFPFGGDRKGCDEDPYGGDWEGWDEDPFGGYRKGWDGDGQVGVFLRGALYWIICNKKIIALDLGTESYRELKLPPLHERDTYKFEHVFQFTRTQFLDVLDGCLFLSDYAYDYYFARHFDVWVMKDYGEGYSWVKLFSLGCIRDVVRNLRPVAYMKDKMQVFMQHNRGFYLFDMESDSTKKVSIHGLYGILKSNAYHGSIFRLHDYCGASRGVMRERRISETKKTKIKMDAVTKLLFCASEYGENPYESWCGIDPRLYSSSSEDEEDL
ncbi:hypothetical protein CASFOL_009433 [Castilleja foliolosa]|uniref:F-box domain-containing protein n=1 Tax=Castilleja foliolosa TaxID=1961234 RepID=A0ABD3DYD3_9LAMI